MNHLMKTVRQICSIFLATALLGGVTYFIKGKPLPKVVACDPAAMSAEELCLQTVLNDLHTDVMWVDARSREDWQRNGLSGSILITNHPAENFDHLLESNVEKLASAKTVIVYCSDIGCGTSKEIANRIRATGLSQSVYALHGGYESIKQANLK